MLTIPFVRKRPPPWSAEIEALRLLRTVGLPTKRVPELICEGKDAGGRWFLTPFYEGVPPAVVPDEVFDTLARIHARFLGSPDLVRLPRLDMAWWRLLCLEVMAPQFERAEASPARDGVLRSVTSWAPDERIARALDLLPRTLVHRDMHNGNVLVHEGHSTIIDWGEAFAGPAFVDLQNITDRDGSGYATYMRTWRQLGAAPRDTWLDDVAWEWATVQVLGQYIGFPLSQGNIAACALMADRADDALVRLGELLGH